MKNPRIRDKTSSVTFEFSIRDEVKISNVMMDYFSSAEVVLSAKIQWKTKEFLRYSSLEDASLHFYFCGVSVKYLSKFLTNQNDTRFTPSLPTKLAQGLMLVKCNTVWRKSSKTSVIHFVLVSTILLLNLVWFLMSRFIHSCF